MARCISCENDDAEKVYRYAIVDFNSTSTQKNYVVATKTTTTIYERMASFEKVCVCDKCIKKERRMYVLKWSGFIAMFAAAALFVGGLKVGEFSIGLLIAFLVISVIGLISVFFYSRARKDVFFAADIRSAMTSKKSASKYRFVPVTSSLYCKRGTTTPDVDTFKQRSGLRTQVADKLFNQFVLPGNGDEMIDSILLEAATRPTANE